VVTLEHDGLGDERFTQAIETAVYRVAQEALTNVARHAGTSAARVRLSRDAEFVTIQVADEGRGFEPGEAQRGGSGLAGMRSRMRALAGQLTIDTGIGAGVRITARIPVPADGHERSGESSP
jgi:signal transduction histidine kinase